MFQAQLNPAPKVWKIERDNSSPGICRQDLAAGFLVRTCFKCASFTLPTELDSRQRLDYSTCAPSMGALLRV
jgi:hypothetical protein